jgi:hypothetical protein
MPPMTEAAEPSMTNAAHQRSWHFRDTVAGLRQPVTNRQADLTAATATFGIAERTILTPDASEVCIVEGELPLQPGRMATSDCGRLLALGLSIMTGSRTIITAILLLAATLVLARCAARWAVNQIADPEPLAETAGRVQLVIDEQDVGLVPQGMPLEVEFAVANAGSEPLVLRQAPRECCRGEGELPAFTIEPGDTGEVTARLSADELLGRGRKHIRFFTSDATSPELWLTIRGSVIRRASFSSDEELPIERSVLVK